MRWSREKTHVLGHHYWISIAYTRSFNLNFLPQRVLTVTWCGWPCFLLVPSLLLIYIHVPLFRWPRLTSVSVKSKLLLLHLPCYEESNTAPNFPPSSSAKNFQSLNSFFRPVSQDLQIQTFFHLKRNRRLWCSPSYHPITHLSPRLYLVQRDFLPQRVPTCRLSHQSSIDLPVPISKSSIRPPLKFSFYISFFSFFFVVPSFVFSRLLVLYSIYRTGNFSQSQHAKRTHTH